MARDYYQGEEDVTPLDGFVGVQERFLEHIRALERPDQMRAMQLVINWISCTVEARAVLTWIAHLLTKLPI